MGKVRAMNNFVGNIGIAHTRWATHGKPSQANSHPHRSEEFCIVNNSPL